MILQYPITRFTLGNKERPMVALHWFVEPHVPPPLTLKTNKWWKEKFGEPGPLSTPIIVSWRAVPSRWHRNLGCELELRALVISFPSFSNSCLLSIRAALTAAVCVGEEGEAERCFVSDGGWCLPTTHRSGPQQLWFWWARWRNYKVRKALRYGGRNRLLYPASTTVRSCSFLWHLSWFCCLQNSNNEFYLIEVFFERIEITCDTLFLRDCEIRVKAWVLYSLFSPLRLT